MTMTDPIADMLTRIRNANVAKHDDVFMPSSKQKEALATLLKSEGYIEDFTGFPGGRQAVPHPVHLDEVLTRACPDHLRVEAGVQAGSARVLPAKRIPRVLGGLGVAIVSTSNGLMTDREARKRNVGGEVLCFVW